jgi:hypothetical protein
MEEYESAMKSYTAAGGGIEGAAAVEASKSKQEEMIKPEDIEYDDEDEVDMLQEDDEDEVVNDDQIQTTAADFV